MKYKHRFESGIKVESRSTYLRAEKYVNNNTQIMAIVYWSCMKIDHNYTLFHGFYHFKIPSYTLNSYFVFDFEIRRFL